MQRDWFKTIIYFLIAFGGSIAVCQVLDWRSLTIATVAGLVAIKALDSNPSKPIDISNITTGLIKTEVTDKDRSTL